MLFPFLRNLAARRDVTSAPNGWYKPIRDRGDNNAVNAFEAIQGPPFLGLVARGDRVGQGPGIQGAYFMPSIELPSNPSTGGLQTANFIGGGPLFVSPDSSPDTEIF